MPFIFCLLCYKIAVDSQSRLTENRETFLPHGVGPASIKLLVIQFDDGSTAPDHAGVKSNMKADKLAVAASIQGTLRMAKKDVAEAILNKLRIEGDIGLNDNKQIRRMTELGQERRSELFFCQNEAV